MLPVRLILIFSILRLVRVTVLVRSEAMQTGAVVHHDVLQLCISCFLLR